MKNRILTVCLIVVSVLVGEQSRADDLATAVQSALKRAGDNRCQIQKALDATPLDQQEGIRFLVAHMPERDLKSVDADFLLENVQSTYHVWKEAAWNKNVPKEIFLNNVLPYASINENRDNWRKDFYKRFRPLVKEATSPAQAAAILNEKIFPTLKVRYSTKRRAADQGPYESIKSGLASCTGLSILLIDACRSVGVPARFVGTPLWTNKSGNHSWVEVWDDGWHFTGAAEPTGDQLDRAWFKGRASTAQRDHRLHAIYAVSFKRTPITFPLVWDRRIDYVYAVNVTDRYTQKPVTIPAGSVNVMFRVLDTQDGDRRTAKLTVTTTDGKLVFEGTTKDERFDANDHLTTPLKVGQKLNIKVSVKNRVVDKMIEVAKTEQLITLRLRDPK